MKIAFTTIAVTLLLSLLLILLLPEQKVPDKIGDQFLPWKSSLDQHNRVEVLGLTLGQSTLSDAIALYGEPESIALFDGKEKDSLEVYYPSIQRNGLNAKLILTLNIDAELAQGFLDRAVERVRSNSSDAKYALNQDDRLRSLDFNIKSLTYVPAYAGLEQEFFAQKFGTPEYVETLSEVAVQWHYPQRGLSLVIDPDGREIVQYTNPAHYVLPQKAEKWEKSRQE